MGVLEYVRELAGTHGNERSGKLSREHARARYRRQHGGRRWVRITSGLVLAAAP